MAAPCVLVASCDDCNIHSHITSSIVKRILGISELPNGQQIQDGIVAYPMHIDTKYYVADVSLCTCQTRTIGDEMFAESVQAIVLHFDTQQVGALDRVKAWLPFLEQLQPTIRLLICNQCSSRDALTKDSCLHWCLDNDFELVELDPESGSTDSEDDFPETVGIERIIEALEAHLWSNMVIKDQPICRSSYMQEMMQGHSEPADDSPPRSPSRTGNGTSGEPSDDVISNDSRQCGGASSVDCRLIRAAQTKSDAAVDSSDQLAEALRNATLNSEAMIGAHCVSNDTKEPSVNVTCRQTSLCGDSVTVGDVVTRDNCARTGDCQRTKVSSCSNQSATKLAEKQTLDADDTRLFEALANEDGEDDSYEQLFEKLRVMKEKANNLPNSQRKDYAEQVALSFLRAIGGDDDIDGMCESD